MPAVSYSYTLSIRVDSPAWGMEDQCTHQAGLKQAFHASVDRPGSSKPLHSSSAKGTVDMPVAGDPRNPARRRERTVDWRGRPLQPGQPVQPTEPPQDLQIARRITRLIVASAGILFLALFVSSMMGVFFLGDMVFHSGSTSSESGDYIHRDMPVAYFLAGLVAGAAPVAIMNAVAKPRGIWFVAIPATALAVGVLAAVIHPLGEGLLALGKPLMDFVGSRMFKR